MKNEKIEAEKPFTIDEDGTITINKSGVFNFEISIPSQDPPAQYYTIPVDGTYSIKGNSPKFYRKGTMVKL